MSLGDHQSICHCRRSIWLRGECKGQYSVPALSLALFSVCWDLFLLALRHSKNEPELSQPSHHLGSADFSVYDEEPAPVRTVKFLNS